MFRYESLATRKIAGTGKTRPVSVKPVRLSVRGGSRPSLCLRWSLCVCLGKCEDSRGRGAGEHARSTARLWECGFAPAMRHRIGVSQDRADCKHKSSSAVVVDKTAADGATG